MTGRAFTESVIEQATLAWLESFGWTTKCGPDISPIELQVKDTERFIGRTV